jgi:hypothetical protein
MNRRHYDNDPMARVSRWFAVTLLMLAGTAHAAEDWKRVADRDGIVIEARSFEGTSMREVRATTHEPIPSASIMATIWRHAEYIQFVPSIERLDVLRDDGDTKLIYERIHMPIVKDRDTTLRVTRSFSPATGVYEVTSIAVPDQGPPPSAAYVRVRASRSVWRLVPAASGGTDVSYDIITDAGGLLPGWIVASIQRDATAKFVRAILDRARQAGP